MTAKDKARRQAGYYPQYSYSYPQYSYSYSYPTYYSQPTYYRQPNYNYGSYYAQYPQYQYRSPYYRQAPSYNYNSYYSGYYNNYNNYNGYYSGGGLQMDKWGNRYAMIGNFRINVTCMHRGCPGK
ncbi:hypothetical protein OESDEN_24719 [Oesophagostomum dentatum]|uniref:Uncharacterized protein n=1 Tax=Oesophagostomum dentatum TaxID=61180 RepID=A0A0B1RXE1_OESDE|nr:hypothetical protein OESDEN_24719 [Oesophagostomum dentatum]